MYKSHHIIHHLIIWPDHFWKMRAQDCSESAIFKESRGSETRAAIEHKRFVLRKGRDLFACPCYSYVGLRWCWQDDWN